MLARNDRNLSYLEELRRQRDEIIALGDSAFVTNDLDYALQAYTMALDVAHDIKNHFGKLQAGRASDNRILGTIVARLANIYVMKGEYQRAIQVYEDAKKNIRRETPTRNEVVVTLHRGEILRSTITYQSPLNVYIHQLASHVLSSRIRVRRLIWFLIITLFLLFGVLNLYWSTGNPLTLLALEIPVVFFALATRFL